MCRLVATELASAESGFVPLALAYATCRLRFSHEFLLPHGSIIACPARPLVAASQTPIHVLQTLTRVDKFSARANAPHMHEEDLEPNLHRVHKDVPWASLSITKTWRATADVGLAL